MKRGRALAWVLLMGWTVWGWGETSATAGLHGSIRGIVMEKSAGTSDVVVFLWDQEHGIPPGRTAEQRGKDHESGNELGVPIAVTNHRGEFAFEDLPEGRYRVFAQKWIGPFRGPLEFHGSVIQLFGWANDLHVPSPEAEKVELRPPGDGILKIDENVPNNDLFVALATEPLAGDPVLGFQAMGKRFVDSVIGINRMPYGRTTVVNAPPGTVHAFFLANDNSPGFAAASYKVSTPEPATHHLQIIAGWSDAHKDPPPHIAKLVERMREQSIRPQDVLSSSTFLRTVRPRGIAQAMRQDLGNTVKLPDQTTATVGEVLAAYGYEELQRFRKR